MSKWEYESNEEFDDDVIKIWHTVTNTETGEHITVDHSSYEYISIEALEAHTSLGFPSRPASAPWKNETIIAAAKIIKTRSAI